MTTPGMLHNILSGSDTNVWLLTICWILLRKYSWNNLLLPSLTRCANYNIQITPLSIHKSIGHISISFDTIPAEIVTMQYRTIIQKLNKYHQLDRSRVMIFQDIHKILSGIADYYENTSTTGTTTTTGTTNSNNSRNTIIGDNEIFNLTHSNVSRLLDNLWTSAALVDDTTTTIAQQSAKGKADTKQKQKYEQQENLEESGIDILRTEYDTIRQIYNESQQYCNSECSFLKWVSAVAIVPSQLQVHYSALNTGYLHTHSAHSSDTSLPIPPASPYKAPSTGSNSSGSSGSRRGKRPDDRQSTAAEAALDTAILDAVPVLGTLEECLLEVIDSYELDWLEISRISSQIDQQYTEVGLTFEEIDQSFQFPPQHETENIIEEDTPMNIYDILDSECTPEMCVNTVENEVFQRHLLKQLSIPVPSAMKELEELRKLHNHTLHRVAKACEKYNPYEIVWSKNAI